MHYSDEVKAACVEMVQRGATLRQAGKAYGVSAASVGRWCEAIGVQSESTKRISLLKHRREVASEKKRAKLWAAQEERKQAQAQARIKRLEKCIRCVWAKDNGANITCMWGGCVKT